MPMPVGIGAEAILGFVPTLALGRIVEPVVVLVGPFYQSKPGNWLAIAIELVGIVLIYLRSTNALKQ